MQSTAANSAGINTGIIVTYMGVPVSKKVVGCVSGAAGAVWLLGLAIFVSRSAMFTSSMVVNPFFEKTVRIQTERGHRVIDTGPCACVRHPGYAGLIG